jgi:Holliday junction DNA helicase RuvA
MISRLRGTIIHKTLTEITIDVNGVGYQVSVPLSTSEILDSSRGEATLLTYMHVREDAIQLFGFATEAERSMFRLLISITGIGPKLALGVLSGIRVGELQDAIVTGNTPLLGSISGVGKKTAERIIVELRGKLSATGADAPLLPTSSKQLKVRSEAVIALMSLGHNRASAENAVKSALAESPGSQFAVEELVRKALSHTRK